MDATEETRAIYGLKSGFLACHMFQKGTCTRSTSECAYTREMLPQAIRDKLGDKPTKGGGKSRSLSAHRETKGKGKSKGEKGGDNYNHYGGWFPYQK